MRYTNDQLKREERMLRFSFIALLGCLLTLCFSSCSVVNKVFHKSKSKYDSTASIKKASDITTEKASSDQSTQFEKGEKVEINDWQKEEVPAGNDVVIISNEPDSCPSHWYPVWQKEDADIGIIQIRNNGRETKALTIPATDKPKTILLPKNLKTEKKSQNIEKQSQQKETTHAKENSEQKVDVKKQQVNVDRKKFKIAVPWYAYLIGAFILCVVIYRYRYKIIAFTKKIIGNA